MQVQKYKQTEIGEIPEEWKIYPLGDKYVVTKFRSGGTPLTSEKEYWQDGKIPFVKIEDITRNRKFLSNTKNTITEKGLSNSSAWLIPKNSLLLSIYASFGESVINKIPVTTNQAIIGICVDESHVDLEFLYYQLQYLKNNWLNKTQENTQKNLNSEIAKKFLIPFPNLSEQQNIASILSNVDNLIQKTDQVIEQTQRLKKGLMQRLLTKGIGHTKFKKTELGEIPEEWNVLKLGDIIDEIRYGSSIKCTSEPLGIPVLRIPNVVSETLNLDDMKYASFDKDELNRVTLKEGDILFVRTNGNKEYVGRTIVFPKINGKYAFASYLIKVNTRKTVAIPQFLVYQLKTSKLKRQILNSIRTSAGQYNLNTEGIKSLKIVLPSINEQQKVISNLSHVDIMIQKLQDKRKSEAFLKKGLMQQLLTGKIRVKV